MYNIRYVLKIFANWILRRCTRPETASGGEIYINGRTYYILKNDVEFTTKDKVIMTMEVVSKDKRG